MILRPYQEKGIADIRALFMQGKRRICYAAPTGSGKTVLFCHAAKKVIEHGQRAVVHVHRQELVEQTCKALAAEGIPYGIIAAGYPENTDAPMQVAMVQTLVRRLDRLRDISLSIIDECHHVLASTWLQIANATPRARVLGASATPERLDGKGLSAVFDALVLGPTVQELIAGGWLAPFVVYAPGRMVNLKGARTVAGDYALGDLARRMNSEVVLTDALVEYRSTSKDTPPSRSASPLSTRGQPPASSVLREFVPSTSMATRRARSDTASSRAWEPARLKSSATAASSARGSTSQASAE